MLCNPPTPHSILAVIVCTGGNMFISTLSAFLPAKGWKAVTGTRAQTRSTLVPGENLTWLSHLHFPFIS